MIIRFISDYFRLFQIFFKIFVNLGREIGRAYYTPLRIEEYQAGNSRKKIVPTYGSELVLSQTQR